MRTYGNNSKKTKLFTSGITALALSMALSACGGGGGTTTDGGGTALYNVADEYSTQTQYVFEAEPISQNTIDAYLTAINEARAQARTCGVYGDFMSASAVAWDSNLYASAAEHSTDMSVEGYIGHTGSYTANDWTSAMWELGRGSIVPERIYNNGTSTMYYWGENVAANVDEMYLDGNGEIVYGTELQGLSDLEQARLTVKQWIDSDGHCALLMSNKITHIGLASVEVANTQRYWTLNVIQK